MSRSPLDEFLACELDDYIRSQLLDAIGQIRTGERYFTYNAVNVLLDADTRTATVEDELDVSRQSIVPFDEFLTLLQAGRAT